MTIALILIVYLSLMALVLAFLIGASRADRATDPFARPVRAEQRVRRSEVAQPKPSMQSLMPQREVAFAQD